MRLSRRFIIGAGAAVGAGAFAMRCLKPSPQSNASGEPPLTAAQFNGTQDQEAIQRALVNLSSQRIVLYRLRSCPYCARVMALLDFSSVKYEVIDVDPLNGAGLPSSRYSLVPQLQFAKSNGEVGREDAGPIVADSAEITKLLAGPLKMERQLNDADIEAIRAYVAETYTRLVFVAMNSSWKASYDSYPMFVPPKYHFFIARVCGATALSFLTWWKIDPKLRKALAANGMKADDQPLSQLLINESNAIASRLTNGGEKRFHGGVSPDLADIDVFGVLSTAGRLPCVEGPVMESALGSWWESMHATLAERRGGQSAQ